MKEPQKWTAPEPWTGYTVTIWKAERGPGEELPNAYKTIAGATKAAQEALAKDRKAKAATIRKSEIWRRTEKSEYSSSAPLFEITAYTACRA
jgi:hypothetical protein